MTSYHGSVLTLNQSQGHVKVVNLKTNVSKTFKVGSHLENEVYNIHHLRMTLLCLDIKPEGQDQDSKYFPFPNNIQNVRHLTIFQ